MNLRPIRVAVIGDLLLDQYVEGDVDRLSPETPVPILRCEREEREFLPGGAGNLARQLLPWTEDVHLFALADTTALYTLDNHGIGIHECVCLDSGLVPRKRRFLAGGQTLLRQDVEQPNYGEDLGPYRRQLLAKFTRLLEGLPPDVVIFSDYGKGTLDYELIQNVVGQCRERKILTVADGKYRLLSDWHGIGVFKCNAHDLARLTYHIDDVHRSHRLLFSTGCRAAVITCGAHPPEVWTNNWHFGKLSPLPESPSVPVNSTVGAGDCFTAILALTLAGNYDPRHAAQLAHDAGRIYVQHGRNQPVEPTELHGVKIISCETLTKTIQSLHAGKKIVFTNGIFDLFHAGHAELLRWAKQQGDILVVGINDDASAMRAKGHGRPVLFALERAAVLAAVQTVDYVVIYAEDTPEEAIRTIRPDVLVKGGEYADDKESLPGYGLVPVTLTAPEIWSLHSSDIIERVEDALAEKSCAV